MYESSRSQNSGPESLLPYTYGIYCSQHLHRNLSVKGKFYNWYGSWLPWILHLVTENGWSLLLARKGG